MRRALAAALAAAVLAVAVLAVACGSGAGPSAEVRAALEAQSDPSTWEVVDATLVDGHPAALRDPRTGIVLRLVPSGEFVMGGETVFQEQPRHPVRIARPFYLGATEVTVEQWRRFAQEHDGGDDLVVADRNVDGELPALNVSWHDALRFCDLYGYRLPTEAEWEYACGGGVADEGAWWRDADEVGRRAWTGATSGGTTHPVATAAPNELGLYDMIGNVWEWCADWHQDGYAVDPSEPTVDPLGPDAGRLRVLRGGCWHTHPMPRPSDRGADVPTTRNAFYGFRVARSLDPP